MIKKDTQDTPTEREWLEGLTRDQKEADNTLRNEIRDTLTEALFAMPFNVLTDEQKDTVYDYVDDLLSAIKNRLPKEKQRMVESETPLFRQPNGWFNGYNTCLAEVRKALDIESES